MQFLVMFGMNAKILEKDENDKQVVYYRMDVQWAYLGSMTDQVTGQPSFSLLTNVAKPSAHTIPL